MSFSSTPSSPLRPAAPGLVLRLLLATAGLFSGVAAVGLWFALRTNAFILLGAACLLMWVAIAALSHYLYERQRGFEKVGFVFWGRWMVLGIGLLVLFILFRREFFSAQDLAQCLDVTLRLAALSFLALAGGLHLFTVYAQSMEKRFSAGFLDPVLPLLRVILGACVTVAAVLFVYLSTRQDFGRWTGWILTGLTLALMAETVLRAALRFLQPPGHREGGEALTNSFVLGALLGRGRGVGEFVRGFEALAGVKVGELWIVGFVVGIAEAALLAALFVGWLSTSLTAVPLGDQGVRVAFGKFEAKPLSPGLHFNWPWPFGQIEVLQTDLVREVALGFDKDLARPQLWTQNHYAGEQNLLVGDGESILTINVPIGYCIADAVAYLKTSANAEAALKSIASRKLLQLAGSRDSFALMTGERAKIARALRVGLQAELDRAGLGLKIIYVGMKDIHPPVAVAPAYEYVVSTQEEQEAMVDMAQAYQAQVIPEANAEAQRLITEAEAAYTKRVDQAAGEAAHFSALAVAAGADALLFRERLRYDALDETLLGPVKYIIGVPSNLSAYTLDFRTRPAPTVPVAPVVPERVIPPEPPER